MLSAHALVQRQVLQLVLHRGAHLHQLVPVQQQLPQIALRGRGYPNPRKTVLQHQLQQVGGVPGIGLLRAYRRGSNTGGIAHPQFVSPLRQQPFEPQRIADRFHAHPHRTLQASIKGLGFARMGPPTTAQLAGVLVQHGDLLKTRVIIACDNLHRWLLSPESWFRTTQAYSGSEGGQRRHPINEERESTRPPSAAGL